MNRLAQESSPYLRQHADNPVDWYPWGDEAQARAHELDRPIFLSIGYSACHWCHVMAHESFEDPAIAAHMNDRFVNVKVDREERPDVDAVYMQAVQALTGSGGWPMSVWLTPDGRPFYAGTYFPPVERHGMPSFTRVIDAVSDAWSTRRDELLDAADQISGAIARSIVPESTGEPDASVLTNAVESLRASFDPRFGGFGRAPKFPPAMALAFLCGRAAVDPTFASLEMITTTLDAMAAGGMYDQLGGGFARYSTDTYWLVPHFEKMLYDNALLLRAYTQGWLITREARYARVVDETIGYLLRDLRRPGGGFASAEDADSEGEEGRFYVWSRAELEEVCGDDAAEAIRYWGVTDGGNFEGRNILHVVDPHEEPPDAVQRARAALLAHREQRVRPGLDDKVLLAWNALAVRALAEAGAAFDRPEWIDAARETTRFLLTSLRRADGRLLRSWQETAPELEGQGRARHLAYADDYAALLAALITLAEIDDPAGLTDAIAVADALVDLFHDDAGGFFTTGSDAPALIVRPKDYEDNATPSENSLAAHALLRLAALTGEPRYEALAAEVVDALAPLASQHAVAFGELLQAIERRVSAPLEIAIVGAPDDPATTALRRAVTGRLLPTAVVLVAAPGADDARISPLLADRPLVDGRPAAYVCERFACRAPVTEPDALRAELDRVMGVTS
ncbi:MAG TPA: thioredoxin domain-containing protein [Acidimicrobiia bacterium]|jgi:hypothetical protein|nr:thioredoxin domain-containing protein [Acidimicrobiia bacterium]